MEREANFEIILAGVNYRDSSIIENLYKDYKEGKDIDIAIEHEKENMHDKCALAVYWCKKKEIIGYVSRNINCALLHLINRGDYEKATIRGVIKFKDEYNITINVFLKD